MRVGIMQPYFFPYIEYFRLIANSDLWIAFDTVKYNKKSWMSRNRILNRDKGWSYINVPIAKHDSATNISDTRVNPSTNWRQKFFDQLRVYEKEAPNYRSTIEILNNTLNEEHIGLADLNLAALARLCSVLEIDVEIARLSELSLDLPDQCPPGEWALHICKAVGANEYVNAMGGRDLFDSQLYKSAGIELSFHKHIDVKYDTGSLAFVADLSIIDLLMWVDVETVRDIVHHGHSN